MKLVSDILNSKGHEIWAVKPDDTVFGSLQLMAEKGIGALLVMDGDRMVGIVTERDYARKVILEGKSSKRSSVAEVMTKRVLCVGPDRIVDECMALMTEKRFFKRLLRASGREPRRVVTDKLRSYCVAHRELIPDTIHDTSQYANS